MRSPGPDVAAGERWLTPAARLVVGRRAEALLAAATGRVLDIAAAGGPRALAASAAAGDSFDTIVSVLQLWRAEDLVLAAGSARAVVADGGRLLFLEPSAGAGATATAQRLLAPLAARLCGEVPTRDLPGALRAAGWLVTDCERKSLPMPWPWRTFVEGSAR